MSYNLRLVPKGNGNTSLVVDSRNEFFQFENAHITQIIPMRRMHRLEISDEDWHLTERHDLNNYITNDVEGLFNMFNKKIPLDEYIEDMEINFESNKLNMYITTADILADFNPHGVMVMGYPKKVAKYLPKKYSNDIPSSCKLQKNLSNDDNNNPPSNLLTVAI